MKLIKVEDAVGQIICHDITQIIPEKYKGPVFRKGHIIKEEDIEVLKSVGKNHIYIWENKPGMLHENEAAEFIRDIAMGDNLFSSDIKEGKIEFISKCDGILDIDEKALYEFNMLGEMIISTLSNHIPVKKGEHVAGTRIIPLTISEDKLKEAQKILRNKKIINVNKYRKLKVGVVTSGNEVYSGLIKDKFGLVIRRKVESLGCDIIGQTICPDDKVIIKNSINEFIEKGADIICCTGGMSVDPDDVTPTAIKETGAEIISYGAPVLPGAMFMLAYKNEKVIMGIPGCAMYNKITIFDFILSRIVSGERLTKEDIIKYSIGGFCRNCEICKYPNCGFGK